MTDALEYYRGDAPMTAAGASAAELRALPRDLGALCDVIQGVLIHRDIAPWLYDLKLSSEQRDIANLRSVAEMLSRIRALDNRALDQAREPARRMPCVCRHFTTMLCAILRAQGVPARARCGFGAYFTRGRFEDHWVAEYWNASQARWILVDAQLDAIQRKALQPDFDPLDVPRDRFIIAGDGWQMYRRDRVDPNLFGLSFIHEQGAWWIASNLIRDLAALNRTEMLPWDVWGMMPGPTSEISAEEASLLDWVAELTLTGDDALPKLLELYRDERLRVPKVIFNADRKTQEAIAV
jgi:Transglutaminase-like superfamily